MLALESTLSGPETEVQRGENDDRETCSQMKSLFRIVLCVHRGAQKKKSSAALFLALFLPSEESCAIMCCFVHTERAEV